MRARNAASRWGISGEIRPIKTGHINASYVIDDAGTRFFLQKVNRNVFVHPEAVMHNLGIAATVLKELSVSPIPNREGQTYWLDDNDDLWRVFPYIEHRSFSVLPIELLWQAGNMYGRVLDRLRGIDVIPDVVIKDFHRLDKYLLNFDKLKKNDQVSQEIAFVETQRLNLVEEKTEFQVIHGDCKINNLLFDSSLSIARYVVDLDTIMTGDPIWDFGDLLRSSTIGGEESKPTQVDFARLRKVMEGFFSAYRLKEVNDRIVLAYAHAPAYMSFMLGVRFLSDHLNGNRYFNTEYSRQNLIRARSQFELVTIFQSMEGKLLYAIDELIKTHAN